MYGYLGILQISSLVLALLNRKITIKALNDSKEIRTIVYITSFIVLEQVILYFNIVDFRTTFSSLYYGHILAATMVAILLIFIPKVQCCFWSLVLMF